MNLFRYVCRATALSGMAQAMALCSILVGVALASAGCSGGGEIAKQGPLLGPEDVVTTRTTVELVAGINSAENDFGATMPLDSTVLFFTSERDDDGYQSILQTRRDPSGAWGTPIVAVVINDAHEGMRDNGLPSITPGGENLYFTGDEYGFGDADLYRVDLGPRGAVPQGVYPWSVPNNLGLNVNGTAWDAAPCISADGSLLYFASNRSGGFGGRDIWVCRRSDGGWELPINAGGAINTPFDETTPWIAPDNQSLVFASNGHPGLGGFDLFIVTQEDGLPIVGNLGTPINSASDDICLSLSSDGRHAFMASNRTGGIGGFDIYSINPVPFLVDPLMIVRGEVRGANGRPIIAQIDVTDISAGVELGRFATDPETGLYSVVLPRGIDYALTAQAPGHLFSSKQVLVPADLEADTSLRVNFKLQTINGTIQLLVFFRSGQSNLLRGSTSDLDRVVTLMRANDSIRIELAGHTDNTGNGANDIELARERARSVKSYLVGNRIEASRIEVKSYGATQPIASNDTPEGRAMNRRVEMRILGGAQ